MCLGDELNTNSFLSYRDVTSTYTSIWALAQPVKCGWAQMSSHVLACEWHEQWECSWARIPFLPPGPTNPNVAPCALCALLTCDTLHTAHCTFHSVQCKLHHDMCNFNFTPKCIISNVEAFTLCTSFTSSLNSRVQSLKLHCTALCFVVVVVLVHLAECGEECR